MKRNPLPVGARDRSCTAPSPSSEVVLRPDVMSRLSTPGLRLAVVAAAGGYGKTSHVAAWAADQERPVAWIDIEHADRDPHVLLSRLVGVLGSVTDFDPVGAPSGDSHPGQVAAVVAPLFGHAVRECHAPFVLVLDDVHLLTTQSAADLLDSLIDSIPTHSMLVVVGRALPSKSLRRRRADADVVEIDEVQLSLDGTEIGLVLDRMGVPSDAGRANELLAVTEGWPVGVRLAGARWHAEARRGEVRSHGLSGREPHVAGYVMGEWLGGLSTKDRNFLMRVSCLDRLSGPSCDVVVGRNDSSQVLHRIFTDRTILIPLDHRAEEYRMHSILRDALRAEFERVDAVGARSSCSRASEWFEKTNDVDRAVHFAVAAGDVDRAEQLVAKHALSFFTNGRYATLSRWLEAMPRDRVLASSSLCLCAALSTLGPGDDTATLAWLKLSEHLDARTPGGKSPERLLLLTFRSLMSTGPEALALDDATRAYHGLPPGVSHAASCLALGVALFSIDNERAEPILSEGAEEAAIWGAPSLEANCRALLAIAAHSNGDSVRALACARRARRVLAEHKLEYAPTLAFVIAVSSLVEAGAGQLSQAREDWTLARRHLAYFPNVSGWTNVQSRIALAHASVLLEDRMGAEVLCSEVREFLAAQPDARKPQRQIAELAEILSSSDRAVPHRPSSLTTAEMRVLHYLPTNLRLIDIGSHLYISRFTVKTHCSSIYTKLAVSSRSEAVDTARAMGLLPAMMETTNR